MGPTKSLVSVILPVYNAGPYLRPALNSLLKQDYECIEIIAIDDGSIDDSGRILREYRRLDKRLQVFSRENRGVVATLNEGISHANGSYIARMDADDIAYPDRIRRQLALLSENPDLAVCGSLYDVILSPRRGLRFEDRVDYSPRDLAVRNIFHSVLCHPTVLFNRFLLGPDLLRYDPDFEYAEDFELFSRISRTHAISVMRQPLLAYRAHSANTTSRKAAAMRAAMLRVVSTNLAHNGLSLERLCHVFSNPDSTAEVIQMLETIRHHRLAFDSCARPAYDSGFEHFVRVAVIEFCRDKGCSWTKTLCDDGELWPLLGKRERWLVQRGGAMPGLALGVYRWGGRSLDLARSARLSDLIPQYRSICSSQ